MSNEQITLIAKWRGVICGSKVTFPTDWHRRMYHKEVRGAATDKFTKRPMSINKYFGAGFSTQEQD